MKKSSKTLNSSIKQKKIERLNQLSALEQKAWDEYSETKSTKFFNKLLSYIEERENILGLFCPKPLTKDS